MPIRTKRIYDPPSPEDGYRLLVMRRWPRGIRRDAVDAWQRDLGPSEPLRVAYLREGLLWQEYASRYRQEMAERRALLLAEAQRARSGTVTLLCSCKDESRCHRTLLKELMEAALSCSV